MISRILFLFAAFLVSSAAAEGDFFDPIVKDIEGWTVHIDPALLEGEHADEGAKALKMLGNHLFFITLLAHEERLKELRSCEIWIEHNHPSLKAMQYHPSVGWLKQHGHDPRLEKKVHIPVANALVQRGQIMKHPMVVLHELAHAYHDQIIGFDDKRVIAAYEKARESGKYKNVLLYTGRRVLHYGMTNHKEYFAEATEAYFNRNDFYPFVQAELKEHDPDMHAVMVEIWGVMK
ncbi:MAG: metallopeptidase [Verrucomicrobiota bacterium]